MKYSTLNLHGYSNSLLTYVLQFLLLYVPLTVNALTYNNHTERDVNNFYACVPVHGDFTIGESGNFASFTSAVNSLNVCGIDGPITFTVEEGIYNEQIVIPAISGTSLTNNITFQPEPDATVILTQFENDESNNYTIKLEGADYITFDNITIEAVGPNYARVIEIGNNSHDNTFNNCTIQGVDNVDDLIYSTETADVNISNVFSNNTLENGKIGINMDGSNLTTGLIIDNNEFINQSEKGLLINGYLGAVINANYVHSTYAINAICIDEMKDKTTTIKNNRIILPAGGNGIALHPFDAGTYGPGSGQSGIYNNFISINSTSGSDFGINIYNTQIKLKVYYNTIHIIGNNSSSASCYIGSLNDDWEVYTYNNIFANEAYGKAIAGGNYGSYDYNVLYSNGEYLCVNARDLDYWQLTYHHGEHSLDINPYFVSNTDYQVRNPLIQGAGTTVAEVATDIEGETRDATNPDIGADEFTFSASPLSGTFTIGGTSPDYTTINDAVEDLVINGVDGSVIFDIASGTYNEQVSIQEVNGASGINTITFQSAAGDSTAVVIDYIPLNETHPYTIRLDGADYLTFKQLTITSEESWGIPVRMENAASHNTFMNNYIYNEKDIIYNYDIGLVFAKENSGDGNAFINNYFKYGNAGIFITSGTEISGTVIRNNIFSGMIHRGINALNQGNIEISGNRLYTESDQSNGAAIYVSGTGGDIINNYVHFKSTNSTSGWGIYFSGTTYNVYYNTVNMSVISPHLHAAVKNSADNLNFKDNIVVNSSGGRALTTNSTGLDCDYNIYYTTGGILITGTSNYGTLSLWQTASGQDEHSLSRMPEFVNDSTYETHDPWIADKGIPITGIGKDIEGNTRDTEHPDIGAYEFTAYNIFSGNYIIGPDGDFPSFTKAVDSINQVGAMDTVVFQVQAGTYTEQFVIKQLPYVTDTIPVTFRPLNSGDEVIIEFQATEADNYIVKFDSTDYVTFQGMTFRALDPTYSKIIELSNGAGNNSFTDNHFYGSSSQGPIIVSESDQDNNNHFENNRFEKGNYALYLKGTDGSNMETGTVVKGNEFIDQNIAALYFQYQESPLITDNTILHSDTITEKWVGIFLSEGSGSGLVANNIISYTADQLSAGIVLNATFNHRVYFNSINISGSSTDSRCFNQENGGGNNQLKNNILTNMANGLAIYITDLTGFSSDYNDIFTSGSWYIYTDTTINDLALWQSRTNQDQHSFSVDPHFLSLTELRTRHPLLNGSAKVFAEVTQDIEGNLRDSTNPDIGAYEYSDAIFDLGQDTTICNSEPLLIDAGVGYDSYSWNTGATTHSITVDTTSSDPVYYKVTVTYYSISYTDSLKVTFNSPVLNLNEEEGLCTGGSVNLDAGTGYASYLWSDGSTTQTLTVTVAGDYYVKVTDSDGCSATDTVAVIESTGPAVDLGPDKELCNGDSLILDGGNGTYTYLWSSGGTDRYLTVYDSGAYRVTVADTYGCENSDSVHVSLLQAPQVDLGDDTGFCEGSSVTLDAGPGYSSYHWADNSTQQTLTVSVEGTYYVTVTNSLGCAGSDTIYVESYPLPSITISQVDGDLVADNKDGLEYHWYLDQQEISNASDTYSPAESGEYYLMIMDNHQCMNSSNTIQYVHTAFEGDYLSKGIRLYPNPAGNRLFISLTGYHGELKITLINMDGKIVFTENVNQLISSGTGEIDVSGLKNGMYVIKIQNKDIIRTKSLLINR